MGRKTVTGSATAYVASTCGCHRASAHHSGTTYSVVVGTDSRRVASSSSHCAVYAAQEARMRSHTCASVSVSLLLSGGGCPPLPP